ncbi:MAG: hypothetical protein QXI91_07130 [Candidatus Bathyarchaeia archaeon]
MVLGVYENFPQNVHKLERFVTSASNRRLQQAIIQALYEVNGKAFNMEEVAVPSIPQCTVIFEFGIAEANAFNYLDKEETDKVLKAINNRLLETMDFFCAVRYYKRQNYRKTPLRFDYYMIRFTFNENMMEIHVFHEKGPRHITPEDIANLIIDKINKTSKKKMLKSFKLV